MTQDMDNLVTITAAASNRHFTLDSAGDKITLWHLKLTGGSSSSGGSILIKPKGKVFLNYCELSGNSASHGGAIRTEATYQSQVRTDTSVVVNIKNSVLSNNAGTAWDARGGAIFHSNAVLDIQDTVIHGNQGKNGGAIYMAGSPVTVLNTLFSNNNGGSLGGAIHSVSEMPLTLRQSTFTNNVAGGKGKDIWVTEATLTLINIVISSDSSRIETNSHATLSVRTCTNTLCGTGVLCSAADANDVKLGVICPRTEIGETIASKALVTDSSGNMQLNDVTLSDSLRLSKDKLEIDGVAITATASEINVLSGVTATASELSILDGVTSSTDDLNVLKGAFREITIVSTGNADLSLSLSETECEAYATTNSYDYIAPQDNQGFASQLPTGCVLRKEHGVYNQVLFVENGGQDCGYFNVNTPHTIFYCLQNLVVLSAADMKMLDQDLTTSKVVVRGATVEMDSVLPKEVHASEVQVGNVSLTVSAAELNVLDGLNDVKLYGTSSKVFSGTVCSNFSNCEQLCTADDTCDGFTSACSDVSKTTQETCGNCITYPTKTTEASCGACDDNMKTSQSTCVSTCSDAGKTTEETCGACDDSTKTSSTTCVDTCYNYTGSTKVFSGTTCLNVTDCTQKCTDSSTCDGWSAGDIFYNKTIVNYGGTACADANACQVACTADSNCEGYQIKRDEVTFNSSTITTQANGASSVYAADLDNDGDMDVLSAAFNDDKIAWYENTDGQGTFSSQKTITTQADGASSVYAADIDGDGDMDVLSASDRDDKIAWYENNGDKTFSSQKTITTQADGARSVFAADIDGDGHMDVLSASRSGQQNSMV